MITRLGFYRSDQTWHHNATVDPRNHLYEDVMICLDVDEDGGNDCEFGISWHEFDFTPGGSDLAPRLEVFSDAWRAFQVQEVQFLFAWLSTFSGDGRGYHKPSIDAVCDFLLKAGFEDLTIRCQCRRETLQHWHHTKTKHGGQCYPSGCKD